jgi:hypothetical protein
LWFIFDVLKQNPADSPVVVDFIALGALCWLEIGIDILIVLIVIRLQRNRRIDSWFAKRVQFCNTPLDPRGILIRFFGYLVTQRGEGALFKNTLLQYPVWLSNIVIVSLRLPEMMLLPLALNNNIQASTFVKFPDAGSAISANWDNPIPHRRMNTPKSSAPGRAGLEALAMNRCCP